MEIITGRLTADAEVREVSQDARVVGFTLAVNHSYLIGEKRKEVARFFECSYWRGAGIADFLKKGDIVQVFGHVGCRAYVTKDAEAAAAMTFRVSEIKLFSSGAKRNNAAESEEQAGDLPF